MRPLFRRSKLVARLPGGASRFGASSRWMESTLEVARWERVRAAGRRWGIWGAMVGGACGTVAFAPANWLADVVASGTDGRIVLADAQGTVWEGSAVAVLTGGPGSHDARSLPGRMSWNLHIRGLALALSLKHEGVLNGEPTLLVQPGLGRVSTMLLASGRVGRWPAAWLAGLGTPWNTLQLGGALELQANQLSFNWAQGRWSIGGSAEVAMGQLSSRVTTLDHLGSYRLSLQGDASGTAPASLVLSTDEGALRLSGQGSWGQGGLHFSGEATAEDAQRGALDNLLNIIGRRQGARSIITIG